MLLWLEFPVAAVVELFLVPGAGRWTIFCMLERRDFRLDCISQAVLKTSWIVWWLSWGPYKPYRVRVFWVENVPGNSREWVWRAGGTAGLYVALTQLVKQSFFTSTIDLTKRELVLVIRAKLNALFNISTFCWWASGLNMVGNSGCMRVHWVRWWNQFRLKVWVAELSDCKPAKRKVKRLTSMRR